MKLVVDIDDELYNFIMEHKLLVMDLKEIEKAIKNGIPLPKGHGKMIDADKAVANYAKYGISHMWDATDLPEIMDECPAIIEADK